MYSGHLPLDNTTLTHYLYAVINSVEERWLTGLKVEHCQQNLQG